MQAWHSGLVRIARLLLLQARVAALSVPAAASQSGGLVAASLRGRLVSEVILLLLKCLAVLHCCRMGERRRPTITNKNNGLSPGSTGHPELCRRRCMFFAAGNCAKSSTCGHCHLPHEHRRFHLDMQLRDTLRGLDEAERLSLLLPLMSDRADSLGISTEALELLTWLEHKLASALASSWPASRVAAARATLAATSQQPLSRLAHSLRKLTFSNLLGLALRTTSSASDGRQSNEALGEALGGLVADGPVQHALERLRAQLTKPDVQARHGRPWQ
ncbi:unnamed protein product [Polarella glacialis]|uniref:C3H1-type domain-containing protein n=1 Tax=Polarella glacialis TaxID=89957 RepID=A0A813FFE3_POLGL|nr:unnamed protein product [Polarella glacialis]